MLSLEVSGARCSRGIQMVEHVADQVQRNPRLRKPGADGAADVVSPNVRQSGALLDPLQHRLQTLVMSAAISSANDVGVARGSWDHSQTIERQVTQRREQRLAVFRQTDK